MSLFSRHGDLRDPSRWKTALDAALKVSEIASSALALPNAVQAVVSTAIDLFGAQQSSIMLVDETGRDLVLVASAGEPIGVRLGHRMKIGEGVAGRVLASGKALQLDDVDEKAFINFAPKDRQISSSVVTPLRANGRTIGVLSLTISRTAGQFGEDDMRIAQMFADQAAGLIHRTKLHEQAERRSSDLAALVESSKGLIGAVDIDSLLQSILDGGGRLAGEKQGFVCLFDASSDAITRGVFRGLDKQVIKALVDKPEAKQAIEHSDLALLTHEERDFVALGLHSSQGKRGVMVLPGDAALLDERGHIFRAFGQQCASALGAAELYSIIEHKESELSSIIQSVLNPIILVDAEGRIAATNPSAEQLFGLSAVFVTGTPIKGALEHEELEDLLCSEGYLLREVQVGNPPRTFKVRATDVRVPGAPIGRLLVMDDITPEREMAQTQHDFVAMIGHELRTPLTIIKGFARTLLRRVETASPEDMGEALNTIDARAAQLERLIEDLLYVSKIESREATLRIENSDLSALAHAVAGTVLEDHPEREVTIDAPKQLMWPCDETKLSLVLRHLIDNALKFSDPSNPVLVRLSEEEEEIQFDIIDKGIGIVSSDVPFIFERFRQLDGSSTREHGGTGVGLYLCSQLVKVHGGRVWVDSTWGKGSRFSFSIPHRTITNDVVSLQGKKVEKSA
ncbi:MAG TPA: ATP-binding protein [Actinomycetota bacterium]|nr:ATP-binding protein [Actinomycetota bacterium]